MLNAKNFFSGAMIFALVLCLALPLSAKENAVGKTDIDMTTKLPHPVGDGPDVRTVPPLAPLLATGARLFYLGIFDGMHGWFVMKESQIQSVYVTPDYKGILYTNMLNDRGENVTARQMTNLVATSKALREYVAKLRDQKIVGPEAAAAKAAGLNMDKPLEAQINIPTPAPAPAQSLPSAPKITPPAMASPATSLGERFLDAMQKANGVNLGKDGAPFLVMVMNPYCPHCHDMWKVLRLPVLAGMLQVRLVPIGMDAEGERAAAMLLSQKDVLNAWDKFVMLDDKTALAGKPIAKKIADIKGNMRVIDAWHIDVTPYMVYRNKAGRVMIQSGTPSNMLAFLKEFTP